MWSFQFVFRASTFCPCHSAMAFFFSVASLRNCVRNDADAAVLARHYQVVNLGGKYYFAPGDRAGGQHHCQISPGWLKEIQGILKRDQISPPSKNSIPTETRLGRGKRRDGKKEALLCQATEIRLILSFLSNPRKDVRQTTKNFRVEREWGDSSLVYIAKLSSAVFAFVQNCDRGNIIDLILLFLPLRGWICFI